MNKSNIETLIKNDLETFLYHKSLKQNITVENASEIAAYVGANFLRIIYAKNKQIKPEEFNGVFGIISNVYNDLFENQFLEKDYENIVNLTLDLIDDTEFDNNSKTFFSAILQNT